MEETIIVRCAKSLMTTLRIIIVLYHAMFATEWNVLPDRPKDVMIAIDCVAPEIVLRHIKAYQETSNCLCVIRLEIAFF